MESHNEVHAMKMRQAYIHVSDRSIGFINSITLKCAIDLNLPDIIHKYGQPMPLSQLIASLPIHPSKAEFISRLMRTLTHDGFFSQHNVIEDGQQEVRYALTDACRLLLKDNPLSLVSSYQFLLDPCLIKSWCQLSAWFKNEDPTPFYTENGMSFWDYTKREPEMNNLFNDAQKCRTRFLSSPVIGKCMSTGVFKGLESLVDVGGGVGTMTKEIAKLVPQLKCIVFDLPRVVANLEGSENVEYVGGDMFQAVPSADSVMLMNILHDWNDEDCVKILNKCKEAIPSYGKVIIIDAVLENETENKIITDRQLLLDIEMMVLYGAKERNEKEWADLIFSTGFKNYKITPTPSLLSIIEVYP
ncbi:hypothetical protein Fmac_021720 [Flemingia macrophylla]|uniref:isoflavone 7-O-methyltransferase n=1 Tax=Flemingia macrophylla TaxID=520843 RepID=A0ABD1LY84_9FABA